MPSPSPRIVPDSEAGELREAATPGPWEAVVLGSEGYDVRAPGEGKRRLRVARCGYSDWDTDKANAALIAAAPDLAHTVQVAAKVTRRWRAGAWAYEVCIDGEMAWVWRWLPDGCVIPEQEPMDPDEIAYIKECDQAATAAREVGGNG